MDQQHEQDQPRTIDDLLGGHPTVAMVMTMVGDGHTSRPVTCLTAEGGRMGFLVDRRSQWVEAIADGRATVHVTVADERSGTYLSAQGTARVDTSEAARRQLWTPVATTWFEGPDDPDLAVLWYEVEAGEWWDTPGSRLARGYALVKGMLTHDESDLGSQGQVRPG